MASYTRTVADLIAQPTSTAPSSTTYGAKKYNAADYSTGTVTTLAIGLAETLVKSAGKVKSDSCTVSDIGLARAISRTFTDAISVIESITRNTGRKLTDALALADTLGGKSTTKVASDPFTLVESISKSTSKTASDPFTLVDALSKSTSTWKSDALTLVESVSKSTSTWKSDALTLVESVSTLRSRLLAFADVLNLSESITRAQNKSIADAYTIVESITRALAKIALADAYTLTDALAKTPRKSSADALTLVDISISRSITKSSWLEINMLNSDSMAWGDYLHTLIELQIPLIETFSKSLVKAPLADSAAVTDAIGKGLARKLTESTLTLVDSIAKAPGKALADIYTLVESIGKATCSRKSDVLSVSESIGKAVGKAVADASIIVDVIAYAKSLLRTFADASIIVESIGKATSSHQSDTISVADAISKAVGKTPFADPLTLVESISKAVGKLVVSALTIVESISKATMRALAEDAVALLDIDITRGIAHALIDLLPLADSVQERSHVGGLALIDALIIVDTLYVWFTNFITGHGNYPVPMRPFNFTLRNTIYEASSRGQEMRIKGKGKNMIQLATKAPESTQKFYLDWTNLLTVSNVVDPITSVIWTVPTGLTLVSTGHTSLQTWINVSGGTLGQQYIMICTATTAGGQSIAERIQITITL